ncbi:hypothetical protein PbB2_02895 [Candidatus Phycosocius bacilliformis]|uniref:Pilus formation protein N-terminal domain-containing protein n=1 Tax=Candidatus Phycosocius bacilliformis TaxID=1445552 RepID=A0A2P2EDR4_9PROT|nr:pilus assembly protein N-terminal domain-containing protein [Candidatus Phycosocius bacilliformis]GBF59203.1 hypothetical protein PbB2_02895 [Candidatus Phycosocius bacilliformis]
MSKHLIKVGLIAAVVFAAATSPAMAQSMQMEIEQTQALHFERPVTGVVIGNAGIADVIVHDPRTLFVVAKSVGSTEVTAVDANGRVVFEARVQVRANRPAGMITIQRGKEISTMVCQERCIATVHAEATEAGNRTAMSAAGSRATFAAGSGSRN